MRTLVVILGPTAVGKTDISLELAEQLQTSIISADSRQLYADLKIGTAAPTPDQQTRVRHHFVGTLQLSDYYSAAQYADEVLALLNRGDTMIIAAVRAGTIPFAITTGHFVVLYGTDGNGNVSVWDPYGYHNEAYNVNTKLWSFDEYFKPHTKDGKSLGAVGFYAFSKK